MWRRSKTGFSQREVQVIVVLAALAVILSLSTYFYSASISSSILSSSQQNAEQNAEIQSSDLGHILSNSLQTAIYNIVAISNSPAAEEENISGVQALLQSAQASTSNFTLAYSYDDQTGEMRANSNYTNVIAAQQIDLNSSNKSFFEGAKQTGTTFLSSAISSQIKSHGIVIVGAQPVYGPEGTFEGIITVSVKITTLGSFVQSQVSPIETNQSGIAEGIAIYDNNGTFVYDSRYPSFVGMNYGTQADIQNLTQYVPANETSAMISFADQILTERTAGIDTIPYGNGQSFAAYQPIFVTGESSLNQTQTRLYLGMLVLGFSTQLSAVQAAQITDLGDFTIAILIIIGGSTIAGSIFFLRLNRGLEQKVRLRTSELKLSNEKLENVNSELKAHDAAQSDFINTAAHELRTPIQPILVTTEMMRDSLNENNSDEIKLTRAEVELLERNAKRLENLTKNILIVNRLENQSQPLRKEKFDLNELVGEIVLETRDLGRPNRIVFLPSDEALTVQADRTRIGEVISNLLSNASRLSDDRDGAVIVSAWKQETDAYVRVRDSGPGIDVETMPRLFTKFFTKSDSGIGLGLYISKIIVDSHGGRIWAENNTDGKGASFTFCVPLTENAVEMNVELEKQSETIT